MTFKPKLQQLQITKQGVITFLFFIFLCVAYIGIIEINLNLKMITPGVSMVWPPTGVSLAALYLLGYRLWPCVFLGALIVNLSLKGSVPIALGLAFGNTVEACLGVYLLRLAKINPALISVRDVFYFILLASVLSTFGAGLIGTSVLWFGGKILTAPELKNTFADRWLSDVVGNLVVAPFLLVWSTAIQKRSFLRNPFYLNCFIEIALLTIATLWLCKAVFGEVLVLLPFQLDHPYFIFPLSLWASLRFGQLGATAVNLYIAYMAFRGTSAGFGPFVTPTTTVHDSFAMAQVFLSVLIPTSHFLAAAVIEKTRAQEELEEKVKQRTESLLKSKQLAEEATRMRDELLGVVSHDLKNPLTGILMGTKLIHQMNWIKSQGQRQLELIELAAKSMNRLITSLLEIYKIEVGGYRVKVQQEHHELAVLPLIKSAVELQQTLAREKKITITINVPGNLPTITGNSELIAQVFQNLLGNALKFTPEGGKIWVSAVYKNVFIIFSVKDTGPGIEPSLIPALFEHFAQAKKTAGMGTGLGLAIAKGIVNAHNGQIWVKSQLGVGSTFYFSIPITQS